MKLASLCVVIIAGSASACGAAPRHSSTERATADAPAITALRDSKFADAAQLADARLAIDPRDPGAAAVRAIARYQDGAAAVFAGLDLRGHWFAFEALFAARPALWQTALDTLAAVDRDLAVAADDPQFSLELCIACWTVDWNHDGTIDGRDRQLLEIERDDHGAQLPADDPRRRPTFRFDVGDLYWARAMVAFQRAGIELLLAYDWSKIDAGVVRLVAAERVKHARVLVLAGLAFSDQERRAYLAETDDDREWVPNPRQHSHAVPLDVDQALYDTWEHVIGDVRKLMTSEQGISLREVGRLVNPRHADDLPDAYVDVGRMFAEPMDIVVDGKEQGSERDTIVHVLRGVLGHGYAERMSPTPLVGRLAAMQAALERGGDELGRKLRYLIWIN